MPPGQVWAVGPGVNEIGPGLYRIEATAGPGSGVRVLNQPTPSDFRQSVRIAEQNLYNRAKDLVGDRDPRSHDFQYIYAPWMRIKVEQARDADPYCAGMLASPAQHPGGTIIIGPLNLGGSIEILANPVAIAELAVDKKATTLLMPIAALRALNDLPDDIWTKLSIEFHSEPMQ